MLTAAEAPRAAAEVIGQLRHELSASIARDNSLLEERSRIMETLASLLDAINHASTEQKRHRRPGGVVGQPARAGRQPFEARTESESTRSPRPPPRSPAARSRSPASARPSASRSSASANPTSSSPTPSAHRGRPRPVAGRSDEQLAYYVAQAREIIDLSIMSQRQIVDDLQQLPARQAAQPSEA
jgi:hypothetical protein